MEKKSSLHFLIQRKNTSLPFGEGFPLFPLQCFKMFFSFWVFAGAGISAILTSHPLLSHIHAVCFLDHPPLPLTLLGLPTAASLTLLSPPPSLEELPSSVFWLCFFTHLFIKLLEDKGFPPSPPPLFLSLVNPQHHCARCILDVCYVLNECMPVLQHSLYCI